MKICLINNLYPPYQKGGAERITEIAAQEFSKQGHQVFVITTKPPFSKEKNHSFFVYYLRSWYYHLNRIPLLLRLVWHIWDLFNWKNYILLKRILEKEKPDVVITHNLKGIGLLSFKAIKKTGCFHVHTLHDIQLLHPSGLLILGQEDKIDKAWSRLYCFVTRKITGSPSLVISPSSWLIDIHRQKNFFSASRKEVILNPVSFVNASTPNARETEDVFYFLYAGQLEKHKGVIFLIQAFKEYQKRFRDEKAKLIITGEGPQFKKAYKISHPNQIIFTGKKTKEQVRETMEKSHCLVIPSFCYENSPTVIYEAINANLPMIASELGGIPELSKKGAVKLFPPGDKEELISAMANIRNNYSFFQKTARQGKKSIQYHDAAHYINRLLNLIEN